MSKIFLNLFWQILISPKSRITCSRENGRFGKISSNQEKVYGFDNFGKFLVKFLKGNQFGGIENCVEFSSNSSKQSQLGRFDNFDEFFPVLLLHTFRDLSP